MTKLLFAQKRDQTLGVWVGCCTRTFAQVSFLTPRAGPAPSAHTSSRLSHAPSDSFILLLGHAPCVVSSPQTKARAAVPRAPFGRVRNKRINRWMTSCGRRRKRRTKVSFSGHFNHNIFFKLKVESCCEQVRLRRIRKPERLNFVCFFSCFCVFRSVAAGEPNPGRTWFG